MKKLVLTALFFTAAIAAMEKEDVSNVQEKLPIAQRIALLEAYINVATIIKPGRYDEEQGACESAVYCMSLTDKQVRYEIRIRIAKKFLDQAYDSYFEKTQGQTNYVLFSTITKKEREIDAKLKINIHDERLKLSKSGLRLCKFFRGLDVDDEGKRLEIMIERDKWRQAWNKLDEKQIADLMQEDKASLASRLPSLGFASRLPLLEDELKKLSKPEEPKPASSGFWGLFGF